MPPKSKVVPIDGKLAAIPNLTQAQADMAEAIDAGYHERIVRQSERISVMVEWMVEEGLLPRFNAWEEARRGN